MTYKYLLGLLDTELKKLKEKYESYCVFTNIFKYSDRDNEYYLLKINKNSVK